MSHRWELAKVGRVGWSLVLASSIVGVPAERVVASDVQPGSEPLVVDVTFDCAADQTPNLIVPVEEYDEVFPAGTESTQYDFSGVPSFGDASLMIDCTPYDAADVECFVVANVVTPPATEPTLEIEGPSAEWCRLPDPRPIGSGSTAEGSGPSSVSVTFRCNPDQTPNLIVPIRQYDEVFAAGTQTVDFDFGEIEFIDTPLMIDCTPYDDADVVCFIVMPPPGGGALIAEREVLGEYCILPDQRPIGGSPASSTTTPTSAAPSPTSSVVTSPGDLPVTGRSRWPSVAAGTSLALGVLLVAVARCRPRTRWTDA